MSRTDDKSTKSKAHKAAAGTKKKSNPFKSQIMNRFFIQQQTDNADINNDNASQNISSDGSSKSNDAQKPQSLPIMEEVCNYLMLFYLSFMCIWKINIHMYQ